MAYVTWSLGDFIEHIISCEENVYSFPTSPAPWGEGAGIWLNVCHNLCKNEMVYSKCFKLFFFFFWWKLLALRQPPEPKEKIRKGGGVILVSTQGLGAFLLIWGKKEGCKKRTLSQPCVGGTAFQIWTSESCRGPFRSGGADPGCEQEIKLGRGLAWGGRQPGSGLLSPP